MVMPMLPPPCCVVMDPYVAVTEYLNCLNNAVPDRATAQVSTSDGYNRGGGSGLHPPGATPFGHKKGHKKWVT